MIRKSFFEFTKQFDLNRHFDDHVEPDIRIRLFQLFQRTKDTVERERKIGLEVTLLIGCLENQNAAVNLGLGKRENLAKSLGMSASQYWKRAQAGRVLVAFPQFIEMVEKDRTYLSHLSILAPKITVANAKVFLEEIPHKSEREVRELVASVGRDGSRKKREPLLDIRLQLTKSQIEILDRAREILSATGKVPSEEDVITLALSELVERRDPLRKAERAKARAEKKEAPVVSAVPQSKAEELGRGKEQALAIASLREARDERIPEGIKTRRRIPAQVVHAVWLRDGGCCSYVGSDGEGCGSKHGLQIDHRVPRYYGENNRPDNLRLLCREHNIAEAQRILGENLMKRYRWLESQRY